MNREDNMILAHRMRLLRVVEGLSQDALAHILNVSRSCIANYETGRRIPDADTLNRFAAYFKVDIAYLRGQAPPETTKFSSVSDDELAELMPPDGILDLSGISVGGRIAILEFYHFLNDKTR